MASIQNYAYELDESVHRLGSIGLVTPATNTVLEREFGKICNINGTLVHTNRIQMDTKVTPETLAALEGGIGQTVDEIASGSPLDVVAFGCTSGAMVIGPARVKELCQASKPSAKVTNPITAAVEALKTLKASPIALVTPYRDEINQQMRTYFEKEGIKVNAMVSFNEEDNTLVGRISPISIEKAALEVGKRDDVNGVFVSCTNIRFAEHIGQLEEKLGKPATSSNHAMGWHALKLLGLDKMMDAKWGSLFRNVEP